MRNRTKNEKILENGSLLITSKEDLHDIKQRIEATTDSILNSFLLKAIAAIAVSKVNVIKIIPSVINARTVFMKSI